MLKVSEVFTTLQGEGTYTGTPSAFIRLYGCSVGCPWCDTPYTWKRPAKEVGFMDIQNAEPESDLFAIVSPEALADWCNEQQVQHVVVTGGEPLEQDLFPLLDRIVQTVQVETSGTALPSAEVACRIDWLTVSPKFDMPGGKHVLPQMLQAANEIKLPVGRERDIERLRQELPLECPIYLQPISQSQKATQLCMEAAGRYGWRVSLQTHKYAGLR